MTTAEQTDPLKPGDKCIFWHFHLGAKDPTSGMSVEVIDRDDFLPDFWRTKVNGRDGLATDRELFRPS